MCVLTTQCAVDSGEWDVLSLDFNFGENVVVVLIGVAMIGRMCSQSRDNFFSPNLIVGRIE